MWSASSYKAFKLVLNWVRQHWPVWLWTTKLDRFSCRLCHVTNTSTTKLHPCIYDTSKNRRTPPSPHQIVLFRFLPCIVSAVTTLWVMITDIKLFFLASSFLRKPEVNHNVRLSILSLFPIIVFGSSQVLMFCTKYCTNYWHYFHYQKPH